MGFDGLLGNETLKKRLLRSIEAGKHSHCYLICGPEGSGKHTLAGLLAQALQCQALDAPCGRCNICRKVRAGIHPDVITVDDPEKKSVSVDLSRQIQADAFVRPNEGKRKIYLIPRAHLMTPEAQNALLKLIEEPPSYAVFLLLATHGEKLLPTVRSRSAELRMEPVSREQAVKWLREKFPNADARQIQAAYARCGGFLGQMLQYLQSDAEDPQTKQFAFAFAGRDRFALAMLLSAMEKTPRDQLMRTFANWKQLLAQAMSVRAGLPGSPEAEQLGRSRTGQELAAAAAAMQKAIESCAANIGAGHICGWLAATME